jgi:hypothetical protein
MFLYDDDDDDDDKKNTSNWLQEASHSKDSLPATTTGLRATKATTPTALADPTAADLSRSEAALVDLADSLVAARTEEQEVGDMIAGVCAG